MVRRETRDVGRGKSEGIRRIEGMVCRSMTWTEGELDASVFPQSAIGTDALSSLTYHVFGSASLEHRSDLSYTMTMLLDLN